MSVWFNPILPNDREPIVIVLSIWNFADNSYYFSQCSSLQVFNYDGQFVRQIGGEGITNYPIGVGINYAGDVVVADNHNNFNLTVFNQVGSASIIFRKKIY